MRTSRRNGVENVSTSPATADLPQRAGVWSVSTWVLPCSNGVTYPQNFREHACRLRQCAQILADRGHEEGFQPSVTPRPQVTGIWHGVKQAGANTSSAGGFLRERDAPLTAGWTPTGRGRLPARHLIRAPPLRPVLCFL